LELGRRIRCPVAAIRGDYDAHPPGGFRETLATVLKDFRFVLLKHCGHVPWIERRARDEFFRVPRNELR
jgi:pimeloyl-ACP methyl ester carboxylesterase